MKRKPVGEEIDALILDAIDEGNAKTILDILNLMQSKYGLGERQILDRIRALEGSNQIYLEKPIPSGPLSFKGYLLDRRGWKLWLVITTTTLIYLAAHLIPEQSLLVPLRWLLGLFFLTFIPGFSLIQALYPGEAELDNIERVALSIGISIALIPLTALALNYTPWGIRLTPILISLSGLSMVFISVGIWREYRLMVRKHEGPDRFRQRQPSGPTCEE